MEFPSYSQIFSKTQILLLCNWKQDRMTKASDSSVAVQLVLYGHLTERNLTIIS